MDWNDLGTAFGSLLGSVVGDQEDRDHLPPPPPKIALSARLQRFTNVLLDPMQKAWSDFYNNYKSGSGADWDGVPRHLGPANPLNPGFAGGQGYVFEPGNDQDITAKGYATQYENYYMWVWPYIDAIQRVIDGKYTGQAYIDILNFLNVTEDDFKGSLESYDKFVKPHMERARIQHAALVQMGVVPSVPAPILPGDHTPLLGRVFDKVIGNEHGENPNPFSDFLEGVGIGLLVMVGGALLLVYLFARASKG